MHSKLNRGLAFAFLLTTTLQAAIALQDPPPAPAATRLVYDLPGYELTKALAARPGLSLDAAVEEALTSIRQRLGAELGIERQGATGFLVLVHGDAKAAEVARRRIEFPGRLEMRVVASDDYFDPQAQRAPFDLAKEKGRLQDWLDHGGKELLRQGSKALDAFHADKAHGPLARGKLRWYPHRIEPQPGAPQRWSYAFSAGGRLAGSTVLVADAADYNGGSIPAAILARPRQEQWLLELVAVNLEEVAFGSADMVPEAVTVGAGAGGSAVINYSLRAEKASIYADWSEKHINHHVAILLDDRVVSAPVFMSRIPGNGQISGNFDAQEAEAVARALRAAPLPICPVLMRQETVPPTRSGTGR